MPDGGHSSMFEREAKLDLPDGFVLPEIPGRQIPARRLDATYWDSDDMRLGRLGMTLRHRTEDGAGRWQLKLPREGGRVELSFDGGPGQPPADVTRLLAGVLRGAPLCPVADMRTDRYGVVASGDSGRELAEVVVDNVRVKPRSGDPKTFAEAEIDLREDAPDAAMEPLERLLRRAGARPGKGKPKLLRALDDGRGAAPQRSAVDALRRSIAEHRDALLRADPHIRLGEDAEAVHEGRVAVRRLRSILRTARPVLDRGWAERLRAELRWLGGALGAVRDMDVLAEEIKRQGADLGPADERGVRQLVEGVARRREIERRALLNALDSGRYAALLDELDDAAEAPQLNGRSGSLRKLVKQEYRRVRKLHRSAGRDPSDEQLHELRKKAKRARYAAEMAAPDAGKPAKRFVKAAKELQDVLGEHQDAVVEEHFLREMAGTIGRPRAALAAGRLLERQAARRARARGGWARGGERVHPR